MIVKIIKDVYIKSAGVITLVALKAATMLAEEGIAARLVHIHTLKQLDREIIINAALEAGADVTIELHSIIGGLGSAVSEILSENTPVPLKRIGIQEPSSEKGGRGIC